MVRATRLVYAARLLWPVVALGERGCSDVWLGVSSARRPQEWMGTMDVYELIARLEAQNAGRARVLVASRRVTVRPDALILCPVMLAGEPTTIHAVAVGQRTGPPQVLCIPDPRNRTEQYALFAALADILERYCADCAARATYPQVWVTASAVVTLLDTIADRIWAGSSVAPGAGASAAAAAAVTTNWARAKQFAQMMHYLAERSARTGQLTLLAAAAVLGQHVVSGRDPAADAHLAALLTWVRPPASLTLEAAVARAERLPMADRTDPEFDERQLEPLVTAYNRLPTGATGARAQAAAAIGRVLAPVVITMYRRVQRALRVVERLPLPALPALTDLEALEEEAFRAFWARYTSAGGARWSMRRSPIHEARELQLREALAEYYSSALLRGDLGERAKQRATGMVVRAALRACVNGGSGGGVAPAATAPPPLRVRFLTTQGLVRARPGDILAWLDGDVAIQVTRIRERAGPPRVTVIDGVVTNGLASVAVLPRGTMLDLGPRPATLAYMRAVLARFRRLASAPPWTHIGVPAGGSGAAGSVSATPPAGSASGTPGGVVPGVVVPPVLPPSAPRPVDALRQVEALS